MIQELKKITRLSCRLLAKKSVKNQSTGTPHVSVMSRGTQTLSEEELNNNSKRKQPKRTGKKKEGHGFKKDLNTAKMVKKGTL